MARLAANLTMMFGEVPFLDRFEMAASAGFRAVEFLFPYAFEPEEIRDRCVRYGLEVVLFNCPPGDWEAGERGIAALPGREEEAREAIDLALRYAEVLRCPTLHLMAGLRSGRHPVEAMVGTYVEAIRYAAVAGRTITIEPLNRRNVPGYLFDRSDAACAILERAGCENARLQADLYHMQISEGDITVRIRELMPLIGHVQIASVPERQEPDAGELDIHYLLRKLDDFGYRGWIGCEYSPRAGTLEGLGWAQRYLASPQPRA